MMFDVALKDFIEQLVRRQGVLVRLIGTKLRRWSFRQNRFWNQVAPFVIVQPARDAYTIVFGTSAITAKPPDISPYNVQ